MIFAMPLSWRRCLSLYSNISSHTRYVSTFEAFVWCGKMGMNCLWRTFPPNVVTRLPRNWRNTGINGAVAALLLVISLARRQSPRSYFVEKKWNTSADWSGCWCGGKNSVTVSPIRRNLSTSRFHCGLMGFSFLTFQKYWARVCDFKMRMRTIFQLIKMIPEWHTKERLLLPPRDQLKTYIPVPDWCVTLGNKWSASNSAAVRFA